jgi:hypothetical protein
MLYWFGVYLLVAIAVLLPFLILYIVLALSWLALEGIRFTIRYVKNASAIRTGLSKEHWSFLHK